MSYTMAITAKIVVLMCHCQDKIKVTLPFSRYMDLGLTRPILSSSLVVTSGLTCIRLDIIKVACTCIQLLVYLFLFDPLPTAILLNATPPNPGQGVMAAAESADLCLALGTSLHGTAPDTVPSIILMHSPIKRALVDWD